MLSTTAAAGAACLAGLPLGAVYHVRQQFLNATQRSANNEIVVTRPKEGPAKGVAIVLGWGGAHLKHLKRTTDWYAEQGVTAVTFTAPMKEVIMGVVELDPLNRLCEVVRQEMDQPSNPTLHTHLFSNNGALTFGGLLHMWADQNKNKDVGDAVTRVVWDSAPCLTDYVLDAAPYSAPVTGVILNKPQYYHWLYTPTMHHVLLPAMRRLQRMPPNSIGTDVSSQHLQSLWAPQVPYLFLYSDNDLLIRDHDVEHFAAGQQHLGRKLHLHKFLGSHHISHFRTFPKEYAALVSDFVGLQKERQQHVAEAAL